jgi:Yip1 domain
MSFVTRAMNILLKPAAEWEVLAKEPATVGGLFTGYAAIMALLPAVASILFVGLLGIGLSGMGPAGAMMGGLGLSYWAAMAGVGYVIGLAVLWLVSFIVKAISPSFNGSADMVQATKLMVYSATPTWAAGLVSWVPVVGFIASLAAMAYAVYLIYLGVRPVLEVPQEKVAGMTVVTVLVYIVASLIVGAVIAGIVMSMFFGGAMMAGAAASGV